MVSFADVSAIPISDRNTTSLFYTMLEAGITLVGLKLPSLRIVSIFTKPGEIMRTVRNLIEFSFLRSNSSNIDASQPTTTSAFQEHGKAGSFSTRPSESLHVTQSYLTNNHATLTIPNIGKQASVHFLAVALSRRASAPVIENMVYDTNPATNSIAAGLAPGARPRPEQHKLFPRMVEVLMKNAT
ncbi:hypothetical protein SCUP234_04277 [Seiridium cupressi]